MNKLECEKKYRSIIETGREPYLVFHTSILNNDQYNLFKNSVRNAQTLIMINLHPLATAHFRITEDSIRFEISINNAPASFELPLSKIQVEPTPYITTMRLAVINGR